MSAVISQPIPKKWETKKLRYLTTVIGGGTPDKSKREYWGGEIPWVSPKDMKKPEISETEDYITAEGLQSSSTNLVGPDSVLVVVRSGILRHSIPVAVNLVPVSLNQDMRALICGQAINPRYLARYIEGFQRQLLSVWSKEGATVESLDADEMASTEIAVPPVPQQALILKFLDDELAVADTLIEAKQKLLELLAEKRRTLVAEAVLRGLDRSTPFRPSGIDWLGDIPAHWEVRRLATLFSEKDERNEPELPLLEVSINTGVSVRQFSTTQIEGTAADFNTYKVARRGSIAFNKMRMWQGAVGVTPTDGLISPDYVVAEPSSEIDADFAGLLFRTAAFSAECARHSQGITWDRLRLYWDGFREISIGLPPLNEQSQIVELQDQEASKIDKLATVTERSIILLKERRSALIAAAVTGQIAIPEAA